MYIYKEQRKYYIYIVYDTSWKGREKQAGEARNLGSKKKGGGEFPGFS